MKRVITLIAMALLTQTITLAQQHTAKQKPLIVQGRLTNFHAQQLFIFYSSDNDNLSDTTNVNADGSFKITTYKIKKPGTAYLTKSGQFYTDLYVAPGYNLTIIANCENSKAIKHKSISGYGSVPNQYIFIRDSIAAASKDQRNWFTLHGKELMVYENARKKINDSVKMWYSTKRKVRTNITVSLIKR